MKYTILRMRNYIWRIHNIFILYINHIIHGKHTVIHGHIGIRNHGKIYIGDFFYMSSGSNMNPLCARNNGYICTEKNAILKIGDYCAMSSPRLWAHQSITIGNNVMLGGNVTIVDSDCHSLNYDIRRDFNKDQSCKKNKPIVIEDDVFIGMNSTILKGVTLGAGCVIGACSVVTTSIPSGCVAAGNPAKVIKKL